MDSGNTCAFARLLPPNRIAYQRAKLAMAIRGEKNAHYRLRDIQPRHWRRLAASCGPTVWDRMKEMVGGVDGVLEAAERKLPEGFPEGTWEPIAAGMRRHADQFRRLAA